MYPAISNTLPRPVPGSPLFIDLEFSGLKPTILGVSSGGHAGSVSWTEGARYIEEQLRNPFGPLIVGHAILTADLPILSHALGLSIPVDRVQDTMIWHYLCNAELCKGVSKQDEEEEGEYTDPRGAGFMDLWTFASLYTRLPNWKWNWNCQSPTRCAGRPCPRHQPFWYNGLDVLSLDLGWGPLMADRRAKGIPDALYHHVAALTLLCEQMTTKGVLVDRAKIEEIGRLIEAEKDKMFPWSMEDAYGKKGQKLKNKRLVWNAPFNPRSPKQVKAWFDEHGVTLGSTEKEDIELALDRTEPGEEAHEWLERLYEYKTTGKGAGPWMSGEYIDASNLLHPRFIPTASSLGRLASSGPNFQNIPSKGKLMKRLREGIIPRPGYKLVAADSKQLELRRCLHAAGTRHDYGGDAFRGLVEAAPALFDEAVKHINRVGWTARDTAKSVTHGGDYGEGMSLYKGAALETRRFRDMEAAGAVKVYRDWEYCGKIVCFNGVNLAKRLFGSATWENRAKALAIQEALFTRNDSPAKPIRDWQRRISQTIQDRGWHQLPTGRYLDLSCNPDPVDRLKLALAFEGQGGGAEYVQEGGLHYADRDCPIAQIHDEWLFERPIDESKERTREFCRPLEGESKRLPGFSCPVDVVEGRNWAECKG